MELGWRLNVARTFIEVADWEKAIFLLNDIIEEDAENPEILYLLSFCYFSNKNYLEANRFMDEIFEIDNDPELLSAVNELRKELEKMDNSNIIQEKDEECKEDEEDWMDLE